MHIPISIFSIFSDTILIGSGIHSTIDACARTSEICYRDMKKESKGTESFKQTFWGVINKNKNKLKACLYNTW